jgi:hypothetical protein
MVFKNKFFLDLGSEGEQQAPVTIAPPTAKPKASPEKSVKVAAAAAQAQAASTGTTAEAASKPVTSQTTAEAIAAQLAAEQASRPAPSLATFAPECVSAGGALPRGRRRGGADLSGFRDMARGMLSS